MSDAYPTGTYVKGDVERVASRPKDAVALAFKGFKLKVESPDVAAVEQESEPAPPTPENPVDNSPAEPDAVLPGKPASPKPAPPKKD